MRKLIRKIKNALRKNPNYATLRFYYPGCGGAFLDFDIVESLLYSSFEQLKRFVEYEKEHGCVDWYAEEMPKISIAWEEALDLYDWWDINKNCVDEMSDDADWQLQRLMAIRRYLWD